MGDDEVDADAAVCAGVMGNVRKLPRATVTLPPREGKAYREFAAGGLRSNCAKPL